MQRPNANRIFTHIGAICSATDCGRLVRRWRRDGRASHRLRAQHQQRAQRREVRVGRQDFPRLARGDLAYKNIHEDAYDGTFDEGVLSFVVDGDAEFEFDSRWFTRIESEFVSSAIGGPPEPFTALNGLFTADFGGINRVVNAMHTEIAVSGGFRF